MAIPVGAPAWMDLAADDLPGRRDFYTALLGWRWTERPDYSVATKDAVPVAGLRPREHPEPEAWTLYLECGGARESVQRIRDLGGKVLVAPTDTPADETFLVAEDPSGAPVGLWHAPPNGAFGRDHAGMLCWAELHTPDGAAADPFYRDLLGYTQEQIGEPSGVFDYTVWYLDDLPALGRFETTGALSEQSPGWQVYMQVNPDQDVDTTTSRAAQLGGSVRREPSDSPHGRTALLTDPAGTAFFVIDTSARTGE
ncbi:VOC family protein [Saccharopolyspora sp. HNM0983]|uniref:VOC family protein n=2 Tax=Saccharopolyspora montiporae TaxID=2781240 RepID=A0A929G024_9PSEU|nr:VOC family protein [Saccharopolyspora sp. HNM0983]